MKALVIGATGYVGSAIVGAFERRGHSVCGLARNADNQQKLSKAGIPWIAGSFDDLARLREIVRDFDTVVFAPMIPFETERPIITALLEGCRGSDRHFIYTSGTGVVTVAAPDGEWDENVFAEDDPFPFPSAGTREARLSTEELVRGAAKDGIRTTVIRPPWIWGNAGGILVWQLVDSAKRTGAVCYVGQGLNVYSGAHVDDVAEAFCLAEDKGQPGALYHTVAGETNLRSVAEAVAKLMGCGTRSVEYQTACNIWNTTFADYVMVVNSRTRCPRARSELGWSPRYLDVIEDIRSGSYRDAYRAREAAGGISYNWSGHGA
jgi:nucleoside-diphosphate-sugar epimerase